MAQRATLGRSKEMKANVRDNTDDRLYQRSRASKLFGALSFFSLVFAAIGLFVGYWVHAISSLGLSIVTGFVSYKLAGGRENPEIYADKDLFGLVRYSVQSASAQIGFHKSRTQGRIVAQIEAVGIPFPLKGNRRDNLRATLIGNPQAFAACRELMSIDCTRDDREYFWDGFCRPKTSEWFNEAEIIISFGAATTALLDRLFVLIQEAKRTA